MGNVTSRFTAAWRAASEDNIGILAAGVSYYAFLALVPLLVAAVLSYGLIADAETVAAHAAQLARMLPASAAELVSDQLEGIVGTSAQKKGLGLLLALALALVGARNGAASIITALTMAFNRQETRSFLRGTLVALAVTVCAVIGLGLVVAVLSLAAGLESRLGGLGPVASVLGYAALLGIGVAAIGLLYRLAVPGFRPSWRAVLPGAVFAAAAAVAFTAAFGIYVANFGNYNATYGSLGAVVVLLTWLYLVAYVLLFGAELDAVRLPPM